MKNRLIPFVLWVFLTVPAWGADPMQEALQRGLLAEEADRDLPAAIEAYQLVTRQFEAQRETAAQAAFRLGECYRKLGRTNDAVAEYSRVVRDFGDQTNLSALSRQMLLRMGEPTTGVAGPSMKPSESIQRQRELPQAEIVLVEQLLAQQKKMREVGRVGSDDVIKVERELLGLQRQLAAIEGSTHRLLDLALPAVEGPGTSNTAAGATFDEDQELRQIREMIRHSPDLINAGINAGSAEGAVPRLHRAAARGYLAVASYLLTNRADVNLADKSGDRPIHHAVKGGHKAMVELLLAHGADGNAKGARDDTPLHAAASFGFLQVAQVLFEAGAQVNARNRNYQTPLHVAAGQRLSAMVNLLLQRGADINTAAGTEGSPLHFALVGDSGDITRLLLDRGASTESRDGEGNTPLAVAVGRNLSAVATLLLEHGADLNATNKAGWTPLHYWMNLGPILGIPWKTSMGRFAISPGDPTRLEILRLLGSTNAPEQRPSGAPTPVVPALPPSP